MSQAQQQRNGHAEGAEFSLGAKNEVFDQLVDTGISTPAAKSVADLLTQDYVLGRVREADREYARLVAKNIVAYVECDHPPEGSQLQGVMRMALKGDLDDGKTALSQEEKTQLESVLLGMFFRTSRSIDGWQQDKLSEQIETRRVEDGRESGDDGPLGGLFS